MYSTYNWSVYSYRLYRSKFKIVHIFLILSSIMSNRCYCYVIWLLCYFINRVSSFVVSSMTSKSSTLHHQNNFLRRHPNTLILYDTENVSIQTNPLTITEGLTPEQNVAIFIIGVIPFLWATYEFWSRIAVGATFGTGKDAVIIKPTTIGKDGDSVKSRGRQVLGNGALVVAYVLFAVAIGSVGIALYSVSTSPLPDMHN